MKILKMIATTVAAIMLAGLLRVAADRDVAAPKADESKAVKSQTTCPVMEGNPINKKLYVDYEGKRIYLCCRGCISAVKKDPAKYVKILEDQGITLDKAEAPTPKK